MNYKDVRKKAVKVKRKTVRLFQTPPKLKFYFGWHYKHSSVKPNRILFESFHGKNISDSPLAVLEELIKSGEHEKYDIYFSTDDVSRDLPFVRANGLPVKLVDVNSRRYTEILATSKYLLNNSSFPAYFIRKPEQVYVQTWHGTPLKTLGKRMRLGMESMTNVQHNFIQASHLTFPNEFTRHVIMRDYNLEDMFTGTVAMVGYPRNSVFMQGENQEIRRVCGLEGFQTFAYMPTWRGTSNHAVSVTGYKKRVESYFKVIDANLRDDQKLFVNFHSMVASQISLGDYKHIFPFPETVGNYDFLAQVDALITDYSSVFFDFALTGKPIVLFAYDLEDYIGDRGFYFSIDELPFPIVYDVDALADGLRSGAFFEEAPGLDAFREKFLKHDSPDNARRVLDLLLERPTPDVDKVSYEANKEREWRVFDPEQRQTIADLGSIFDMSDPARDIVLLPRAKFNMQSSAFVHDAYRDDRNYLFFTRTTPRTFAEAALSRVSSNVRETLHERERLRALGELNISEEIVGYCVVERGRSYSESMSVDLAATVVVGDGYFAFHLADVPGALDKVFVARGREIIWTRSLTTDEVEGRFALIEAADLVKDFDLGLKRNERCNLGVSFISAEDGAVRVGVPVLGAAHPERIAARARFHRSVIVNLDNLDLKALQEDSRFEYSLLGRSQGRNISLTPYFRQTGKLALFVNYQGEAARDYVKPIAKRVVVRDGKPIRVISKVDAGAGKIVGARIVNREESIGMSYEIPCSVETRGRHDRVSICFDPDDYRLDGVYWDLVLEYDGGDGYLSSVYVLAGRAFRTMVNLVNTQRSLDDGNILFPYSAKGRKLAFTHRPPTKSDAQMTKVKELAAFAAFAILHPYWKRKRMWLVYEKFCSLAQDNAFRFFEYCMTEADPEARKFVYYVIDKDSPDYANVAQYEPNVIDFMSFRHMLYCMVAKIYVASDSKPHLYQWRPKPSVIRRRISKHKIFFLQHGVTALKRVDKLFGMKGSSPMTYFLTTSPREQEIVVDNFGYTPEKAPVLGFSRWDSLIDASDCDRPVILLMPTWRSWLEEQSDDFFLSSDYYRAYSSLVQNESLQRLLRERNARIKFFIHPKLNEHLRHFESESSNVEFVEMGTRPLSDLIMECSMLVTDYSSVCWDVLFMGKPVVFYQFDQKRYIDDIGAYIDLETELPGPLCKTEEECVEAVLSCAEDGFVLSGGAKEKAEEFLPLVDRHNRARTYHFLIDEGF